MLSLLSLLTLSLLSVSCAEFNGAVGVPGAFKFTVFPLLAVPKPSVLRCFVYFPGPTMNDDVHGLIGDSVLRREHPWPNHDDVHGLIRFEKRASVAQLCDVLVYSVLRSEHPCPDYDDVGGPIRSESEHPWPNHDDINDIHGSIRSEKRASMAQL